MPGAKWWKLWKTIPDDYTEWSSFLFQKQLIHLREAAVLTIKDINKVTQSEHYEEKYRALCLKSLQKIKRSRTVYRLKINPKISVKEELNYLEGIAFITKDLANLPKVFEVDEATKLLAFKLIQYLVYEFQSTIKK